MSEPTGAGAGGDGVDEITPEERQAIHEAVVAGKHRREEHDKNTLAALLRIEECLERIEKAASPGRAPAVTKRNAAAVLVLLALLSACASPAEREAKRIARNAGVQRADVLMRVKKCGGNNPDLDAELREGGRAPDAYSQSPIFEGAVFRDGFAGWVRNGAVIEPTEQECRGLRQRPEYSRLFSAPRPQVPLEAARKPSTGRDPGAAEASYCAAGSVALMMASGLSEGQEALRARCRPGDTVIVPAAQSGVIASACDLSKPVVSAGLNVFCTLGRIRPTRAGP
jgi:hypothetical protein